MFHDALRPPPCNLHHYLTHNLPALPPSPPPQTPLHYGIHLGMPLLQGKWFMPGLCPCTRPVPRALGRLTHGDTSQLLQVSHFITEPRKSLFSVIDCLFWSTLAQTWPSSSLLHLKNKSLAQPSNKTTPCLLAHLCPF